MRQSIWVSLGVTLVAVLAIKSMTGLAIMPMLLVAIGLFGLILGLALRLERGAIRH